MLEDLSAHKSSEKFHKSNDRAIRDFGYGDTEQAIAIAQRYAVDLSKAVEKKLKETKSSNKQQAAVTFLRLLDPDVVAVCALQTCLHSVAIGEPLVATSVRLGRSIQIELFADALDTYDTKLAARIDLRVRKTHGSLKYRVQAARSIAKRAGFSMNKPWNNQELFIVGGWLVEQVIETLGHVFEIVLDYGEAHYLTITPEAQTFAQQACIQSIHKNPVFLPMPEAPPAWTGPQMDIRGTPKVVRSWHRETNHQVKQAIASGQMQPCLDALNSIQATGYRINGRVLDVMKAAYARGIEIPDFPRAQEIPMPDMKAPWNVMSEQERVQWKIQAAGIKKANRIRIGNLMSFTEDTETAELFRDRTFYTPCNLDWRGRVYSLPHFNFQREDRVRALFLFEEGKPLGSDGLWWLKVHLANCGDFEKVSKKPFEERVAWVDENLSWILDICEAPLSHLQWTKADKPFLFLAACMEYGEALRWRETFISHLPVSWDGSCSGLQHLCAMTRAEEGEFVNLTDTPEPQDVYQRVADVVKEMVALDATEGLPVAKLAHAYGITRKVVKRNVMTYSYSSKKPGMSNQMDEDLMEPLRLKVMMGELEDHPFEEFANKRSAKNPSVAARYLAGHTFNAIETIVKKPAEAMGFLQKLARAMAHEGKPLEWTTPVGLPWSNRYHASTTKTVRLWLHNRGVNLQLTLSTGFEKDIAKDKAANGVAPNFVHALDAAHLMLSVNAAVGQGMRSFAMVHDSFGCHASDSGLFNRLIREEFVNLYTNHDVLDEVYQRAKCDLNEHNWRRLPDVVQFGALDINGVKDARYAFA